MLQQRDRSTARRRSVITMGKTTDILAVDFEANDKAALSKIDNYYGKLKKTDQAINDLGKNSKFAAGLDKQLAASETRFGLAVKRIKDSEAAAFGSAAKDSFLGSAASLSAAGAAAGAAIGAGLVIGTKAVVDAAREATDAQRVLAATAKETGASYDELAAKAETFGKKAALSNTDAQRTFSQLVNFANAAGRTDKLDEFTQKFTDLAAAKGINASQLGDISRQLNALTDEATDKLLNANSSAFYDKFAASLHKTAEQLTDAEKRAAVFDEVLRKGSIFDGEADRRLNSFSGQVDTLGKNFDDLKTKIGAAILPLAEFLTMSTNTALTGNTPEAPSPFWLGIIKTLQNPLVGGGAGLALFGDTDTSANAFTNGNDAETAKWKKTQQALQEGYKKNLDELAAALDNANGNLQNFALSHFLDRNAFRGMSAVEQEKAKTKAMEAAKEYLGLLDKSFQATFKTGNLDQLSDAFSTLQIYKNVLRREDLDKYVNQLSEAYSKGLRKILSDSKAPLSEIRETLKQALKAPELTSADREAVTRDFRAAIEASVKGGMEKIEELGKSTDQLFDRLFAQAGQSNPFVKVFTDADKAIENVRISTALLSKELQQTALELVRNQNAADLFSARLDSRLSAFDLRSQAEAFRNGNRPADSSRVDPATFERIVRGAINNRENIAGGGTFARDIDLDFTKLTDDQKRDLFEQQSIRNLRRAGQSDQTIASFLASQRRAAEAIAPPDANLSIQERLDKQLSIIEGLNPTSEAERAIADRRIIALTQGLKPDQLTDRENRAAAQARENEAARIEGAETKAQESRTEQLGVQKSIDANIAELLKVAKSEGLTGTIRIINEADDRVKVSLGKRPTDRSTEEMMNQ